MITTLDKIRQMQEIASRRKKKGKQEKTTMQAEPRSESAAPIEDIKRFWYSLPEVERKALEALKPMNPTIMHITFMEDK